MNITQQRLKELFNYEPKTGIFTYRQTVGSMRKGEQAGWVNATGYRWIGVDGNMVRAAVLAWIFMFGVEPKEVEYIDGDRDCNRIENLKESNSHDIRVNNAKRKGGKLLGTSFYKRSGTWIAYIRNKGKRHHIGYYRTEIAAHKAYLRAVENIKSNNGDYLV